jgi:hypothetical protein
MTGQSKIQNRKSKSVDSAKPAGKSGPGDQVILNLVLRFPTVGEDNETDLDRLSRD